MFGNCGVDATSVDPVQRSLSCSAAKWPAAALHFRNDMEVGPGGKQIQLGDPDGNPIVLFAPARRAH
jgi:hypothetical protein